MTSTPVSRDPQLLEKWKSTLDEEVVHSPCPPVDIPNESLVTRTLRSLRKSAEIYPDKAALIDGFRQERYLTYRQTHDQSLSLAAFLLSRGFKVGDRATTVLSNCVELPVIHLGVWAAGGIFVGSITSFKQHETVYQLRDSASAVIFTSQPLLNFVLTALEQCPVPKPLVLCIRSSSSPLPDGIIDFQEAIYFPMLDDVVSVSLDAPCFMSYSSGTTGLPKGVTHTHRSYQAGIEILMTHFQREIYPILGVEEVDWRQDHQIVAMTCYHMLGFGVLNWWLLAGSPVILMERMDETLYPQLIEKYKPRYLFVTPPIFAFLAKHPQGIAASLDSVQLIMNSGAPLSKDVCDVFLAYHPSVKYIVQGYGMTETGYSHLPLLLNEGSSASSGVVAPNYLQKIVVPGTNQSCRRGEWGEILVKGPGLTVEYRNQPELFNLLFDEDGWLHTSDVGYMDDVGCIVIVDRLKELIKMSATEVEGILLSHHKIKDVAVVGIPHEDGGERVRAFVVRADEELREEEVKQIVQDKLAVYKQLTGGVYFVDAIPRQVPLYNYEVRVEEARGNGPIIGFEDGRFTVGWGGVGQVRVWEK